MKTLTFAMLLLPTCLVGQGATHSVILTLTDTANPSGTLYSYYRASGPCAPSLTFTKIANALNSKTFLDANVAGGETYCYYATAVSGTNESAPSTMVTASVPTLFAPSTVIIVIQ